MDASRIESMLALASAKSSRAHQRITAQLDFTSAGMKRDAETREFLIELEFAVNELTEAAANISAIKHLYAQARRLAE